MCPQRGAARCCSYPSVPQAAGRSHVTVVIAEGAWIQHTKNTLSDSSSPSLLAYVFNSDQLSSQKKKLISIHPETTNCALSRRCGVSIYALQRSGHRNHTALHSDRASPPSYACPMETVLVIYHTMRSKAVLIPHGSVFFGVIFPCGAAFPCYVAQYVCTYIN